MSRRADATWFMCCCIVLLAHRGAAAKNCTVRRKLLGNTLRLPMIGVDFAQGNVQNVHRVLNTSWENCIRMFMLSTEDNSTLSRFGEAYKQLHQSRRRVYFVLTVPGLLTAKEKRTRRTVAAAIKLTGLKYADLVLLRDGKNDIQKEDRVLLARSWRQLVKLRGAKRVHALGVMDMSIKYISKFLRTTVKRGKQKAALKVVSSQFDALTHAHGSRNWARRKHALFLGRGVTTASILDILSTDERMKRVLQLLGHGVTVRQAVLNWAGLQHVPLLLEPLASQLPDDLRSLRHFNKAAAELVDDIVQEKKASHYLPKTKKKHKEL